MKAAEVLADLLNEQQALDDVVATLNDEQLRFQTPSPRWTIADQLAHLTYFDRNAALAITDPEAFQESIRDLLEAAGGGDEGMDQFVLGEWRNLAATDLISQWRIGREELAAAAQTLTDSDRISWYGPSMSAKSFLTARLMECWAHGQDIVDTLVENGVEAVRTPTVRLAHIARLGYLTRDWSYLNRSMTPPEGDVAVELIAPSPSSDIWRYGESDTDRVSGPAEDFCLVVTQRRHVGDTNLVVEGDLARDWLLRAQAFAGPATDGPAPTGDRDTGE